jgi:PAS domain S-box-containing protein
MSAETIKALRKTPIFSTLDSSSLKKIAGFFKGKTFSVDEVLFKEGTLGDTLYIIKQGAIKITRSAKEGDEETSRSLRREGDIFGESGFIDESPRPATAQATMVTKVLELCRSDFLTILNNDPLIAYQIVKVLSSRLKQSDLQQIEELKEKNEHLQRARSELQKQLRDTSSKAWSDESPAPGREQESLSRRVLSCLPYPLILEDEQGNLSLFNRAAEKQFGYKSDEVLHKPAAQLWDDASWTPQSTAVEEKLKAGDAWEGQIVAKKSDGERFACHATILDVFDDNGKSAGRLFLSSRIGESAAGEVKKEPLELRSFFEQELAVLKSHEKFQDITLTTDFGDDTPTVEANKKQLQQVLCALLDNAASALQPVSGRTKTITIEVRGTNDGRGAQIMVSDNGVGIGAENLPRLFKEPFTTKPNGAGLGLLTVGQIVKDHGGSIEAHSDQGAYTLFVIKLPAYQTQPKSTSQPEPALESPA